jgi:hypothetical protein
MLFTVFTSTCQDIDPYCSDFTFYSSRYITKGLDKAKEMYLNDQLEMDRGTSEKLHKLVRLIEVFDRATNVTDEKELCYLIKEHKLTWEQCNSELLKSKEVWIALLPHMPIEATIRNLGRMTKNGLFAENSEDEQMVRYFVGLNI